MEWVEGEALRLGVQALQMNSQCTDSIKSASFDQIVGLGKEQGRDFDVKRFLDLQIEHELELGDLAPVLVLMPAQLWTSQGLVAPDRHLNQAAPFVACHLAPRSS